MTKLEYQRGIINVIASIHYTYSCVLYPSLSKLKGRCDSFVLETDVHYPTDINLLLDAIRKMARPVFLRNLAWMFVCWGISMALSCIIMSWKNKRT